MAKPKSPNYKLLEQVAHPHLPTGDEEGRSGHTLFENDPSIALWMKKKMSPEEYVNLLSGQYGHGNYWHLNSSGNDYGNILSQHQYNTPINNDKALKKLIGHEKAIENGEEPIDGKHVEKDSSQNLLQHIAKKHTLSDKALHYLIENPDYIRNAYYGNSTHLNMLKDQPNLDESHLNKIIETLDDSHFLGDLIKHPKFNKDLAQKYIDSKPKLAPVDFHNLIGTVNHDDPNKKLIDNKDIESLLLSKKLDPISVNQALDFMKPDKDLLGQDDHSRKKEIIDQLLGIDGGSHDKEREDVDHPDEFGYNNWNPGDKYSRKYAEQLASSKHLTPDQIDHIKRHGDFDQKIALFENPNINKSHAIEMYDNWINSDTNKGYDLDDLTDHIRKNNDMNDHYDDYHDEATQEAQEEYPFDEYIRDYYNDDDFMDGKDEESWIDDYLDDTHDWMHGEGDAETDYSRDKEDHPEYKQRREAAQDAYDDTLKRNKRDMPEDMRDKAYEGYDESLSDTIYQNVRRLHEDAMETAHENYDYLPDHLRGHLPHVDSIEASANATKEEKARIEAAEKERKAGEHLDEQMPKRDNKHAYGDLQHHVEMAKDYADANGGAIDIGHLNKMHPNLKDTWKKVFNGKGKLSSQELEQKHQELPKVPYDISYGKWTGMQNINERPQSIIRLDHSPESLAPIKADEAMHKVFTKIQDVSQRSGHPTNHNSIAWSRVDTTDPKHWMIDEVQSDFGSAARDYLDDNGKGDEAEEVNKIIKYHKNWREALINKVISLAKQNGVEKVSTHSPESKAAHTGADTVHSVYKDSYQKVPRAMGFKSTNADQLPLSDEGKRTFNKGKSKESVTDRINEHLKGAEYHAQMAISHDRLAAPSEEGYSMVGFKDRYHPSPEDVEIHAKHKSMHSQKMREHLSTLAQLDPTHWAGKEKLPVNFLENYHEIQDSWGNKTDKEKFTNSGDTNAILNVGSVKSGNLSGIPVITYDAALSQPAPQQQLGHTLELKPEAVKKSLIEAETLMKSELDKQDAQTKIAMTLKAIQENQQILEQLKESSPEAYQSIMELTQSMVELFKQQTGEDLQNVIHEMEIQEQLEQQQDQQNPEQQGQPQEGQGPGRMASKDEPIRRAQMNYAPGSVREDSPQSARVKQQDGSWKAYGEGLGQPQSQGPQGGDQ